MQSLLDDAVARKAFTECAPLQDKLEALIRKRKDLPTINELKEAVRLAEAGVANAAARRDFAGAATAQVTLDEATERLNDALQCEGDIDDAGGARFQSRADLEIAISEVTMNIDNAIATKDFNNANKYQAELEVLEGLRATLPSVDEIEQELGALKAKMEEAIKEKNFTQADSLQNDIEKLETKLEAEKSKMPSNPSEPEQKQSSPQFTNEKGEKVTFESRHELENEIVRYWDRQWVSVFVCFLLPTTQTPSVQYVSMSMRISLRPLQVPSSV